MIKGKDEEAKRGNGPVVPAPKRQLKVDTGAAMIDESPKMIRSKSNVKGNYNSVSQSQVMLANQMRLKKNLHKQQAAAVAFVSSSNKDLSQIKNMSQTVAVKKSAQVVKPEEIKVQASNDLEFNVKKKQPPKMNNQKLQQMMSIKRQIKAQQFAMKMQNQKHQ